jgi:BON domain
MNGIRSRSIHARPANVLVMKAAMILLLACLCSCASLDHSPAVPDDSSIRDEVRHDLDDDGFTAVTATVDHGVVTLMGHLASSTFREKAVADAERASGVTRVVNEIDVP